MNAHTERYYTSCQALGLNPEMVKGLDGFKVRISGHDYFYQDNITPLNNTVSNYIANNSMSVDKLLKQANLPVPQTMLISRNQFEAGEYNLKSFEYPLIAQPIFFVTHHQVGKVFLKSAEQVNQFLHDCFNHADLVRIEAYYPNLNTYECYMLYQHLVHTIENQAAQKSDQSQSLECKSSDAVCIHPDNLVMLEKAMEQLDLNFAKVTLMGEDLSKSYRESECYIVNVDPSPELNIHHVKLGGKNFEFSQLIVASHRGQVKINRLKKWLYPFFWVLGGGIFALLVWMLMRLH